MDAGQHRRLKALFQEAREKSAVERSAFLSQLSLDDPELATELQHLLQHDRSRTLLATPPTSPVQLSDTDPDDLWTPTLASDVTIAADQKSWLRPALTGTLVVWLVVLIDSWVILVLAQSHLMDHERSQLQAHCLQAKSAIEQWLSHQFHHAEQSAKTAELVRALEIRLVERTSPAKYSDKQICEFLQSTLELTWGSDTRFSIWNREMVRVYGSPAEEMQLGKGTTETGAQILSRVLGGSPVVRLPNNKEMLTVDFRLPASAPKLAFIVPIRRQSTGGSSEDVLGALLIRSGRAEHEFNAFFSKSHFLETGETYAFARDGHMISQSRMFEQLRDLGLLETSPDVPGTEFVSLRDPGVDLTLGLKAEEPRSMQPDNMLLRQARVKPSGANIQGYRDYRGRMVIGAWEWLEPYEFGIAVEMDYAEAIEPLQPLIWGIRFTVVAFVVSALWICGSWYFTRRNLQRAIKDHTRIGPYVLGRLIGEGGMGKVYYAHHDWLKRPTALKVLKPELNSPAMLRRFTREVQCASQLQHPNTVDIFDYGSSQDGRFFYAMEYLIGISLHQLVTMFGPVPAARAIAIGRQLCGSLREAHHLGMVHRDIKPQNIMICVCGGEADVVKVVDFGLVKATAANEQTHDTGVNEWAGTPKYMAPERLLHPTAVDPRSDLYSAGAVLYWLLTGREVFSDDGLQNLLASIVTSHPRPFSSELNIPASLEAVVMRCLAKIPSERYPNMATLQQALDDVAVEPPWKQSDACAWWESHLPDYWQGDPWHTATGTTVQTPLYPAAKSTDRLSLHESQNVSIAHDR